MFDEIGFGFIGFGLGLGLRHGIDWDHLAAITNLTATQTSKSRAFFVGFFYSIGHAFVVATLGLLAIWLGTRLPSSFDLIMDVIVGLSLVVLGVWIIWFLYKQPNDFRFRSRWMLIFTAYRTLYRRLAEWLGRTPISKLNTKKDNYGLVTSTGIGPVHGIGAETGTQTLLIASVMANGSSMAGSFLLLSFVVGLVIANSAITVTSIFGFF